MTPGSGRTRRLAGQGPWIIAGLLAAALGLPSCQRDPVSGNTFACRSDADCGDGWWCIPCPALGSGLRVCAKALEAPPARCSTGNDLPGADSPDRDTRDDDESSGDAGPADDLEADPGSPPVDACAACPDAPAPMCHACGVDLPTGCATPAQCDDGNPCTVDTCHDNECVHVPAGEECCQGNTDCLDDDPCTNDTCAEGRCRHDNTCCTSDAACDDQLSCTSDTCTHLGCMNVVQSGACRIEKRCWADGQANPGAPCQACSAGDAPHGWSVATDGTPCGDGGSCAAGVCCLPGEQRTCCGQAVCSVDSCGRQGIVAECPVACVGGACVTCVPSCADRTCGSDGCGGSCGACPADRYCKDGTCACVPSHHRACCGDALLCTYDSCGTIQKSDLCASACFNGACCTPNCSGKTCGSDGCGGSCGGCPSGQACVSGACQAQAPCGNGTCESGENGENCGTCPADCPCGCGQTCQGTACVSTACRGLDCGSDGCGGTCGSNQGLCASAGDTCVAGVCTCNPSCAGRQCGWDGCAGSCGTCPSGHACMRGTCIDAATCADQPTQGTCLTDLTPAGEKCSNARVIGRTAAIAGFVRNGDTTWRKNDDDTPGMFGNPDCWDAQGDETYRVWVNQGETLTVTGKPLSATFQLSLKLYRGTQCAANWEADLIACQWKAGDGAVETYTYQAQGDGWVSIVVDGARAFAEDQDWGPYELTVTLADVPYPLCCP